MSDPRYPGLYKRCLAALARMVVYAEDYKPSDCFIVNLSPFDVLYQQELGDRIVAAKILAAIFRSTSIKDDDWQSKDALEILLSTGYADLLDPGPDKVYIPDSIHWENLQLPAIRLPPVWELAIRKQRGVS